MGYECVYEYLEKAVETGDAADALLALDDTTEH
jgi:hypothetical protein